MDLKFFDGLINLLH